MINRGNEKENHMRALLIDPIAKTITEVDHNGDYHQIYEYLSDPANGLKATTFDSVRVDNTNVIYVDDDGLLKDPRYFFMFSHYHQPLAGRGLVLGVSSSGDTIATTLTVKKLSPFITYTDKLEVIGMEHTEGVMDHPIAGPNVPFLRITPKFRRRT
jgi:hypothetical protein